MRTLLLLLLALTAPAIASAKPGWAVDSCYTKAQLAEEAARPGVQSQSGLEPEISPGVAMDTRDTDTESPFFDKTLEWKLQTFAQMMNPQAYAAMLADHAKSTGETIAEAQTALTNQRMLLWSDLVTNGIRIHIAALFRDPATGQTAKLLSDDVPDSGQPTKFCVVSVQVSMRAALPLAAALALLASPADAQTVGDKIDELASLRTQVASALDAAVNYAQMGDRESTCSQARYAQSSLTRMDDDVRMISAAVAGPGYDADDRAAWAAKADQIETFVRNNREVAMADWQRAC